MATRDDELAILKREVMALRDEVARLRIPGPIVDPAPWAGTGPTQFWDWWRQRWPFPIPRPGDPAPFDSARFRMALNLDLREVAGRVLGVAPARLKIEDIAHIHIGDIIGAEPGIVVDPAPDDVGRWVRIDPRLIRPIPWPWPGDPAPLDLSRFKTIENIKLVDAVAKTMGVAAGRVTIADLAKFKVRDLILQFIGGPVGPEVDPPPIDYTRFAAMARSRVAASDLTVGEVAAMDRSELQATEHRLNADIIRLESLRDLVRKKLRERQ
ncbi:MAG TPA: hypothetical protein VIH18_24035 [Candidatus Binatia bacterium]|jgi:hypothetical protein